MAHLQLPNNVVPINYDLLIRPGWGLGFSGSVSITIDVLAPTHEIILNSVDLEFDRADLIHDGKKVPAKFSLNNEIAILKFDEIIETSEYKLEIDYRGLINVGVPQGLFFADYDDGRKRMLMTQFEAVSARRFLPCWDEPARKATFSVAVIIPKGEMVVSNMPLDGIFQLGEGLECHRFQKTPRMSSYLLFVAIGDFERLEKTSGKTKIAVVARKGSAPKGEFALESAVALLDFYNDYFGVPYPLPKLDLIAVLAAGGFSAMENWGAIMYFEDQILLDPRLSSESDRQRVFVVVAHEMAHQWFGNLVTMEWWDDLWLNEGFASWMENKATEHLHPEWLMWLQSEAAVQGAMQQDAKSTTHPVVQPVQSGKQADQAFDTITYYKGRAVVRMLENYLGEGTFRTGVRTYMERYAYRNTVTDQFWAELERASSKEIKQIARDFTLQPGIPMLKVESATSTNGRVTIALRQERFGVDEESRQPLIWHVPTSVTSVGKTSTGDFEIVAGAHSTLLSVDGSLPIKLNSDQTAYCRVFYPNELFVGLKDRFMSLSRGDQVGLLYDTWALGEAGDAPITNYLDLTQRTSPDADSIIWQQIIRTLRLIDSLYGGLGEKALLSSYSRNLLSPVFARVSWETTEGESDNTAVLRERLISSLGRFGDDAIIMEARRRFADLDSIPSAIRDPILRLVALTADKTIYDKIHDRANKAEEPGEKRKLFTALAFAQDKELAALTLSTALGDEPPTGLGPSMISTVSVDNPELAWKFALDHLAELKTKLDPMQQFDFVPSLASSSTDPAMLPKLRAFIDKDVPEDIRKKIDRFYADLKFRLEVIEKRLPEISGWLKAHGNLASDRPSVSRPAVL